MYYATGQIDSTIELKYNNKNKIINKIVTKWSPKGKLIYKLNDEIFGEVRLQAGGMKMIR